MAIDISGILEEVNGLCAADKANINSVIFKRYLEDADFPAHHEILTEIRNGQLVPIIDAAPDYGFLKVSPGGCGVNTCDISTTSSVKKWAPADYNCRVTICKEDLDCDFRKFWDMNCKDYDNMEDAFIDFLVMQINKNVNSSQWRIGYFDDTEGENPDFAGIDGLFKQWAAIATVGSNQRVEIAENSEATFADQLALGDDTGYTVFKSMYDLAAVNNPQLLSSPGLHFDATPQLAYNYLQYLQANREVGCCFNLQNDGITSSGYSLDTLNYLGIPIRIRNEWWNIIQWQAAEASATNYDDPHRAVLTTRGNKPVGTCDDDAFREFDMFYDRKDREILITVGSSFDAKVVVDSDFILAM